MRTANFGTGTITYPDEIAFAFNPMLCEVKTSQDVTVTISSAGASFVDKRQAYKDKVIIDIALYVQTLFKADTGLIQSKDISVRVTTASASFDFTCSVIWGAMNVGDVFNASRTVTWFKGFPFTFSMYVPKDCTIRKRSDKNHYTTTTLSAGLHHLNPSTLFNPHDFGVIRVDDVIGHSTFEYTFDGTFRPIGDGTIINRLVVDERTCGVYLRWIDRHGFYQYYLFEKGEDAEMSKNGDDKTNEIWNDGRNYYYDISRILGKSIEHHLKVCALFVNEETYEMIKTICTSPIVDLYVGNDKWLPVNIADQTSVSTDERLRDYEIELILPTIQIQRL